MPVFQVQNDDQMARFARIDNGGKKVTWVNQAEATDFPDPDSAMKGFESACAKMLAHAEARLKSAQDQGLIIKDPSVSSREFFCLKKDAEARQKDRYADCPSFQDPLEHFCSKWLLRKKNKEESYHIASRPTQDDLLGVFETFYARSSEGWLARPQRKSEGTGLVWNQSFSHAVPFSSALAAKAELDRLYAKGHIVKATNAFTEVIPVSKPEQDHVADSIQAACSARDIESAINESAQERLRDLKALQAPAADAAPRPARSRL